jgi:hypothetical protein
MDAELDDASCERACGGNPCVLGMVNNQRVIFCEGDAQKSVTICPG